VQKTLGELKASKAVLNLIGNTSIIKLGNIVPASAAEVWLKFEAGNPTGSYKDRMAMSILQRAIERNELAPGDTVVEYTGGSTGSSLAFVSAAFGLKFIAVFSDAFSQSKQQTMEAFGSEVIVEKSHGKGITPELIKRMKDRASDLCENLDAYYADQFGSPDATLGYEAMGQEIAKALDCKLDIFCASVGTGGAIMGARQGLIKAGATAAKVVAFEPAQSPFLTTGKGGAHKVEGVGVGFEPPFLDRTVLSDIRTIDQDLGFAMCRRLAREEGIFCGASTGLNVAGAIDLAKEMDAGQRVVTLACDSGLKYLGSHIYT
tara:strand:- start:500 stop:1453 length:954 start_codon:yes stop_codon:yes gene_type:complete